MPTSPGVHARSHDTEAPIASVRDGVFFTRPAELPRGPHKLTRDEVQAAQRERLLAAATELLGARGYRGFGPTEIAGRAGVSLKTFYACFENKDECVFAGYDRFIEVLLNRMTAVELEGKDRAELTDALIAAYLETLQSDVVVARAYQVEVDALGPAARERRRRALTLFADYIRAVTERATPEGQTPPDLPWTAYIGVVYAARQIASDALEVEAEPDLAAIGENLTIWVADLFRDG
jgi:AcrR family transcriptional regulator